MKTIYLLRHAKSSWGPPETPDHERPLNERGRKAAKTMGRHLRHLPAPPDLVVASTARRVSETLAALKLEKLANIPVIREKKLYLAPPERLLSVLLSTSDTINNLLIIGHNPGIHAFALQLSGEVADEAGYDARDRLKAKYPTAALAAIEFPTVQFWRDIKPGGGRLVSFTTPKDL